MDKQKALLHIMASPVSIDILSNLSGAVSGLPFQNLVNQEQHIQQHLSEQEIRSRLESGLADLLIQGIVAREGENYSLTKNGINLFKIIQKVSTETSEA